MSVKARAFVCAFLSTCVVGFTACGDDPPVATALPRTSANLSHAPSAAEIERRRARIRAHFQSKVDALQIQATTTTRSGKTIDWIRPESQVPGGRLSTPPSTPPSFVANPRASHIRNELQDEPGARGPAGTVPIVRFNVERYLASAEVPPENPEDILRKTAPPAPDASGRYYVNWQQTGTFFGTNGTVNIWNGGGPVSNDNSIGQGALFHRSGSVGQSVEAGKIENQGLNGDSDPHLFIYYTTNNWGSSANWVGGYNTLVQGWVQVGSSWTPGVGLGPWSVTDGAQYEINLEIRRNDAGDWWIWVGGEWMGYYSRCIQFNCAMFGNTFANPGLRDNGNRIDWYGEIFDSAAPTSTTTDMGSGAFANQGWGRAAWIRNMTRYTALTTWSYIPTGVNLSSTDTNCYTGDGPHFNGGASFENYFYYGGPGRDNAPCL